MSFNLEEAINTWLMKNNNISIINTTHVHLASSSESIYTILYRDGEKKDLK